MAPPAEALGSGSPHGPRDPSRTCSGLRPPEAGRARASRKVREPGKGGESSAATRASGPGGTLGATPLRFRPVADCRARAVPEGRPAPRQARGGRTRRPRVLLARAWRSLREAALAVPGGPGLPPSQGCATALPSNRSFVWSHGGPLFRAGGFRPSLRRPGSFH